MKKVAILQSAYIPWRGYFDLIASVDTFIFYDDVQFSQGDWRNRNIIRTNSGPKWLTIPVPKKHRIQKNICDVECSNMNWQMDHLNKLSESYRKSKYFSSVFDLLKPLYERDETYISKINHSFIKSICDYIGITTNITWSWDYQSATGKTERLVDLCRAAGAATYVSGPAAKSYLDVGLFDEAGIAVEWFSYDGLEPYPQIHGAFENQVSIVDLLFNAGPESRRYIPSARE
ncbi:MAG: WbqC family protein [Mesorhizobium sp.]|nr:WbqC family protein [Mesorhizobium sp.]MBN9244833.1 WbqC family protein [Mesorhizobium sp.]